MRGDDFNRHRVAQAEMNVQSHEHQYVVKQFLEDSLMYYYPSGRKQITSIQKNGGFIVLGGGVMWLYFTLAGLGVITVDYMIDEKNPATIAQTQSPVLAEN